MRVAPSRIGASAEAAVAAALVASGWSIYLPAFGAHGRVDLVMSDGFRFFGVQCKAGRVMGDVILFRTCSNTANSPKEYGPEVDYFGVYASSLGQTFLVPAATVPSRECTLRLTATRNRQSRGVRWADDYLVPTISAGPSG